MSLAHSVESPARAGPSKHFIRRSEVLRTLAATVQDDVPLILLEAPAGFGKTTVLRQWATEDARVFTWVRMRGVGADLDRLLVSIDRARQRTLGRSGPPPACRLCGLMETLQAPAASYVLVLDGPEGLDDPAGVGAELIRTLTAALPPHCQLVIASRDRLGPALNTLPGGRRSVNLGPDQLAFATDETREALARTGVQVSDELVRRLMEGTRGWPGGIGLEVQALQERPDGPTAAHPAGDDVRLVEYFRDEVLDRQCPEVRRFLLQTSVLEELTGPLCDAVLATTTAAATLAEIHTRNLFIDVIDVIDAEPASPIRYRYHPLFAAVLRSELRLRYPDEEQVLHRRAASWFVEHRQPIPAIEHAIAGRDIPTAARLICRCAAALVEAGQMQTVCSWLRALGDQAPQLYPPVGVTGAWLWALAGDLPLALRCALAAERGSFEGASPDGSSSVASGVAMVRTALAPLGIEQMLVDAERAIELEAPGSRWYPTAAMLLGNARLMNDDADGAVAAFTQCVRHTRPARPAGAQLALAQMALIAASQDDWTRAAQHAAESAALMQAHHRQENVSSVLTHVAIAAVATRQNDRPAALQAIGDAARLYTAWTPVGFPWFAGEVAIAIGLLLLALGDEPGARLMADTAREQVGRLLTEGILGDQLRFLEDKLDLHERPDENPAVEALSAAELRVLELLPTHLRLSEIGDALHLSRNTVKSHVAAIHRKLGCGTRAEAVRRARKLGLIGMFDQGRKP